ncbi:MAG TPA: molybdenum cofactor biosynthesis protein MoaE [Kofleriaceae bacterium]|nr:molybdenum cofactor biosynthesis protein MoaE [Kofleriaceae bacterium]
MKIQVLYFAVFRERLGVEGEALVVADGATVGDALAALEARHAIVKTLRGRYRVAVNQSMVGDEQALAEGDELVLIPPVAGGEHARHVVLTGEPLSLDRCLAAVSGPEVGGVVTFTGLVRRHSRGVTVQRLDYEAYGPMAVKVMTELCDEIEREIAGARLAVEHRIGSLAIGDAAVVIAAAAPHRAEAFAACRALIDRLKERVPIWKKELGSDGDVWVGLGP